MKNRRFQSNVTGTPRAGRPFRYALLISVLMLSILAVQGTQVWASAAVAGPVTQVTSTASTSHMTVQLVFPASAYRGQSVQISATTTATSSANIVSFSIDIASYVNGQLVKLVSQTIVANTYVQAGDVWQTLLVVAIPTDAQPGPLIGTITEVSLTSNYYYSYYGTPYYYYRPNYVPYYYTQNLRYYNTRASNAPQYGSIAGTQTPPQTYTQPLKGPIAAIQIPPQTYRQSQVYRPAYVYQPSCMCQPLPHYAPIYSPNYYATQVSSQQTIMLTYVI